MPNRQIRDVARLHRPITVDPTATVRTAAHMMKEYRIGSVLVVEQGRLTGIFTERDALCRVLAGGLDPDRTPVGAVMTADPVTVPPDRLVVHALHTMRDGGFRHLPVVEDGRPIGMVSIRDALGPELSLFERECRDMEAIAEILA